MEDRHPCPFAEQGEWVRTPNCGDPEAAIPFGAWIQGPGTRVLGPPGFTGASGHAPVDQRHPKGGKTRARAKTTPSGYAVHPSTGGE